MGISIPIGERPHSRTGLSPGGDDGGPHAAAPLDGGSRAASRIERPSGRGPGARPLGLSAAGGATAEPGRPRAHRGPAAGRGVDLSAGRRTGGAGGAPPEIPHFLTPSLAGRGYNHLRTAGRIRTMKGVALGALLLCFRPPQQAPELDSVLSMLEKRVEGSRDFRASFVYTYFTTDGRTPEKRAKSPFSGDLAYRAPGRAAWS